MFPFKQYKNNNANGISIINVINVNIRIELFLIYLRSTSADRMFKYVETMRALNVFTNSAADLLDHPKRAM